MNHGILVVRYITNVVYLMRNHGIPLVVTIMYQISCTWKEPLPIIHHQIATKKSQFYLLVIEQC